MNKYSEAEIRRAVEFVKRYPTKLEAAAALGISPAKLYRLLEAANTQPPPQKTNEIALPDLPNSDLGAEELIERACERFERNQNARDARKWMPITVKSNKPIGVCFMGDPHVDDNGCNWPLLRRDIKLLETTDGLHAVNIGDLTNNWIGRLLRIYADQEVTKSQGWTLAKYILKDANISWLCHLLGNHDAWGDGSHIIKAYAKVPVEDWQARFKIVFPNKVETRVYVAHDFPGNSIWNKMHGPQRAALLNDEAEIYACGHKHEWGINTTEHAHRSFIYHLIRSRGYKMIDDHADHLGFGSQKYGASITAIIDPNAEGPSRVTCFADLAEAADYLGYKRAKK